MSNGTVFSDIAGKYDRINSILSFGQDQHWRERVVDHLPTGRLLDLGGGTGAANPVFESREIVALDPAPEMLAFNPTERRVIAVGEALPFGAGVFDAVFSAYVFRNLDSVGATLDEVARVLRRGGRAGIVGLGRPKAKWQAALHRAGSSVTLRGVGLATGAYDEYSYLHSSLDKLPPPEVLYAGGPLAIDQIWRMGPLGFVYGAILEKT